MNYEALRDYNAHAINQFRNELVYTATKNKLLEMASLIGDEESTSVNKETSNENAEVRRE